MRIAGGRRDRATAAEPASDQSDQTAPVSRLRHTFSSLAIGNFRLLWVGMLFTMAAFQVDIVARSWLAYDLSNSGFILGVVAISRGVPQLLLAPLGGVAADRVDKRTLLIATQVALAVLATINAVLVQTRLITIWQLVLLGIAQGLIFPFMMPTRTAYIADLVNDQQLPNALALDSSGRNLNRVIGPTLAGFLIAWHPAIAFYAIALFFGTSALLLLRLPRPRRRSAAPGTPLDDMRQGLGYIRGKPHLLGLLAMSLVVVLIGMPFSQLLPVFQKSVFAVGARQLGLMYSAVGIGAIVGSLATAYLADSSRKALILLGGGFTFGVMLVLFALSPSYMVAMVFLFLIGIASQGFFTTNRILLMLNTDKAFYGRVVAVYGMTWPTTPVALLFFGWLVDQIGAPSTIAGAGLALATIICAITLLAPGARHLAEPSAKPHAPAHHGG